MLKVNQGDICVCLYKRNNNSCLVGNFIGEYNSIDEIQVVPFIGASGIKSLMGRYKYYSTIDNYLYKLRKLNKITMNKNTFDESKFYNKGTVLCNTEEKAINFLAFLQKRGYRWRSGDSLLENTRWGINRETTCYSINYCEMIGVGYGDMSNHLGQGQIVYEWEIID